MFLIFYKENVKEMLNLFIIHLEMFAGLVLYIVLQRMFPGIVFHC